MPLFLLATPSVSAVRPIPVPDRVTFCHRTNSINNPYVEITTSVNAVDGSIRGGNGNDNSDHTSHTGPVFDPSINYPTPRNGDQWGDIIPSYTTSDGRIFPGQNEITGAAYLDNNCNIPTSPPPTTGSVTIVKDVAGGTDAQDFNFSGGVVTSTERRTFSLDDDGITTNELKNSESFGNLQPGQYTVTESAVTGFTVTDINCGETTRTLSDNGRTATFTLEAGNEVTCTFVNTKGSVLDAMAGSITIIKSAPDADGEEFDFATSSNIGAADREFKLGDEDNKIIRPLALGQTYMITEEDFRGFSLTKLECSEGGSENLNTRTATIMLSSANSAVTCTFTNTKDTPQPVVFNDKDVTLCHATGSITNPFVRITVSAAGAANGHYGKAPSEEKIQKEHQDGRDIIPAFTFKSQLFPAQNASSLGLLAFEGCVLPAQQGGGIGGDGGGRVLAANIVVADQKPTTPLSLFTPQVLGASTSGPNRQLANTGNPMLVNLFAGLFIVGMVTALTATQKRQYS